MSTIRNILQGVFIQLQMIISNEIAFGTKTMKMHYFTKISTLIISYKQHLYKQPSTQVMEQQATEYSTPSIIKQPPKMSY